MVSLAATAAADEIRLKDGTKIIGTIVGFEDNSFKVQTAYGFALVRKDKVAAIVPSEAKPEPKSEAKKDMAEAKKPAPPTAVKPASPQAPAGSSAPPAKMQASPAPGATAQAQPAAPPAPSAPPPIRDEVQGNVYVNYTYAFRMYKPPGWHIIEGAQKALPAALVAMGTPDETTLFVVGRVPMKESLVAHAAATERQLREVYENYRRITERRTRVAGLPALERRYRGTADGHDWSGVVLSLARGNEIFTILGMTYADSDLIQIQENVITKTIASLQFSLH